MSRDYEYAIIYAITVLGVDREGQRGTDRYPPILLKLIKITRFFVVEKAQQDIRPEEKEKQEQDKGNRSRSGSKDDDSFEST